MIRAYVRPTLPADAPHLAPLLRTADKHEIDALVGMDHLVALEAAVAASVLPFTIMDAQTGPIGLMGCTRDPGVNFVGYVWLLGSDGIFHRRMPFLRQSRLWLDVLGQPFKVLANVVDERNTRHIRWLKWLGFSFIQRHEHMGVQKLPFLEFVRII